MSTYAIKADKFFLPADPQLGGYLMVEDGVFGAWQADEGRGPRRRVDTVFLGAKGLSTSFIPQRRVNGF